MDDTQKSRTSDANSTRKRRSSILKSQRPPRTPFSELEFNVATPTDTVKSRRVSFSRRTGVAEFVTNEATTTWKNFYEEHNKSLESSGNDTELKAPRQTIGQIGKRIFDQQFEEVEAVDFLRQLNNPSLNINTSINNINLTQQLATLENTDNIKLSAPHANFELSTFTDQHSKLFGDEFTAQSMGEMSERIDIDFSDIQTIDQGKDDLDEIQRDLARVQNNVMYTGPFSDRQNMSEYIEIDLNTTHITMGNEQSDMSITDTIHSQVQDVSKSCSFEKKLNQTKDWVTDKENIAINPYVQPRETVNFAINEEADKVLVFDGKRLTLQNEVDNQNYRKTLIPNGPTMETPQRKTIVLNVNDDLPNFIEDMQISKLDLFRETVPNHGVKDLSQIQIQMDIHKKITSSDQEQKLVREAIPSLNMPEKDFDIGRTVVYENDTCNISITQVLPAKIIDHKAEKRETILYDDDGNMSVTQAMPLNVVLSSTCTNSEKRRTILFEEHMANISMTQALPINIINNDIQGIRKSTLQKENEISMAQDLPKSIFCDQLYKKEKRNTTLFQNAEADVSVTHAIATGIFENPLKCDKNRTVMFGNDTINISVTQAVPNNIIVCEKSSLPERRKTILYNDEAGNISLTQAIPSNIIVLENKSEAQRSSIAYENDIGNISVMQAIPSSTILSENEAQVQRRKTILYGNDTGNISVTQAIPSNIILPENEAQVQKRKTILYGNDTGNISVTQAIPSNIILPENEAQVQRRKTILYGNDTGNISVTQAIPSNIILSENEAQVQRRKTILYENDTGNISVTQAIPSNIILSENEVQVQRRKTILYENDTGNISVTQAIPSNIILPENEAQVQRRKTILYGNDTGNISVTQSIPSNIILPENEAQVQRRKTILYENDTGNISVTQAIPSNIILPENETQVQRRKTILYGNDTGNISVTQAIPSNIILPENEAQVQRRKIILYGNDTGNISVTQAIPSNIILPENETQVQKRKTMLYGNDTGNISVTQAIPSNIILPENESQAHRRQTILYENETGHISITEAIPSNIIVPANETQAQKRRTKLYKNDTDNVSITQTIPTNMITPENITTDHRRTIMNENDVANISNGHAILNNIVVPECEKEVHEKKRLLYGNNAGNISVTQAISSNIIVPENETQVQKMNTISCDNKAAKVSTHHIMLNSNILSQGNNSRSSQIISSNTLVVRHEPNDINLQDNYVPTEIINSLANGITNNLDLKPISNNMIVHEDTSPAEKENNVLFGNATAYPSIIQSLSSHKTGPSINNLNMSVTSKTYIKNNKLDPNCYNISTNDNKDKQELHMCGAYEKSGKRENIRDTAVFDDSRLTNESEIYEQEVEMGESRDKVAFEMDMTRIQEVPHALATVGKNNHTIICEKGSNEPQGFERSCISEDCMRNVILTKPIPTTLSLIQNEFMEKSIKESKTNRELGAVNGEMLLYPVLMKQSEGLPSKTNNQVYFQSEEVKDEEKQITVDTVDSEQNNLTLKDKTELSTDAEMIDNNGNPLNGHKGEIDTRDVPENPKIISLDNILDMSNESLKDRIDNKNVMVLVESDHKLHEDKNDNDNISAESMFYITKDSDDEYPYNDEVKQNVPPSSPLEKRQEKPPNVDNLQKKLVELGRSIISDDNNSSSNNRHYEKIVCLGVENETDKHIVSPSEVLHSMKDIKGYKTADDTDYLLKMLSDLTENKVSDIIEEDENPEAFLSKENNLMAFENKNEVIERRRISFEPREKVLSREDLLTNIAPAHAALQKSRCELNQSDNYEDIEKNLTNEKESSRKKTVRMSHEVVKTLHFEEDDTTSESSVKSDKISPLKKTAFGETSYMKECKTKVIPSYLKDVSDGIKALMCDLVKPTADTMPFETIGPDNNLKKSPSTCSTQIQANLITSSQIDLDTELYSNPTSTYDIKTQAAFANEVTTEKRSISHARKSPILSLPNTESEKSSEYELNNELHLNRQGQFPKKQTMANKVLVFDHENPLNNVFFAPTDCAEVHKYNPATSNETLYDFEQRIPTPILANDKDIEVERVSMQYNVDSRGVLPHDPQQSGDSCVENFAGVESITSTTSKPMSIDQSTDVRMVEVKDIEINTSITMKGNKELLEASSSLTLVDDALTQNVFDVDIDTNTTTSQNSFTATKSNSPVKIIYQIDECGIKTGKIDSDFTSNDEETSKHKEQKRKKRNYNSTKHKNSTPSDLDVTPKPISKVQKMSSSPKNIIKKILDLHRVTPQKNKVITNKIESIRDEEMSSPDNSNKISPRKSKDKAAATITVQRLITEYHIETSMDQKTLNKQIVEALTEQPEKAKSLNSDEADSLNAACSFTSSKNNKERDDNSTSTNSRAVSECSVKGNTCVNWQTDIVNEIVSRNLVSECDSSANVVAKIDMLPFMGSHECEWECSSADTWSFRLLHARLRLTARLAHRHDNAARTSVRADTPLVSLDVHVAQNDNKNPVATTCVRFALETMRHLCSSVQCLCAGEVPALLRRCAGAARLAARWGRHMHAAHAHLAYTLTDDGRLTLKVANIPLRSVWEVSMRLELAAGEGDEGGAGGGGGGGVPWPRACAVRVSRVVSEHAVSEAQVRAALAAVPHDWGHVPRTVWRIFKYLKNKTRDDDLLAV